MPDPGHELQFFKIIRLIVFVLVFITLGVETTQGQGYQTNPSPTRPKNVLLIVSDDGGFELGIYNNTVCKTPNIDKFGLKSVLFKNAFVSTSSCSPSRSAILTGRPQHENGMYGLHQGIHNFNSLDSIQSISSILIDNGIRTGIVGKKHVGPSHVYPFDYAETEENNSILQVGRNITHIRQLVNKFLSAQNKSIPFFLYVAFHDPHRDRDPSHGPFCEKFGNGEPGQGLIPDWKPTLYKPENVQVPYFIPQTREARRDIAAQYTTISRLDQGVGLVLSELAAANFDDSTLVIYTSDNGVPFPRGRTNLHDPGMRVPMIVSSPLHRERWGQESDAMVSLLDITPTILDWFNIPGVKYSDIDNNIDILQTPHFESDTGGMRPSNTIPPLTGRSVLPQLVAEPTVRGVEWNTVFASHSLHEITMYYPMRVIRTNQFKLIQNLNYRSPFPIDQDFYASPTFQDILRRTKEHLPLNWYTNLHDYYFRAPIELYDLNMDPHELNNLAQDQAYQETVFRLEQELRDWQKRTMDPWICASSGVVVKFPQEHCGPLYNDENYKNGSEYSEKTGDTHKIRIVVEHEHKNSINTFNM